MYTTQEVTRIEDLMKGQSEILQLITQGKSLEYVLEKLTKWAEKQSEEGMIASVLCTDEGGQSLYHCAGSSLPDEYLQAINGLPIGPDIGSCGTAAYTKKPVIVENIGESELWKNYKHLAKKHNLASCWSTPLINNNGTLRGTFALYYNVPKKPTEKDQQLITLIAHTALLAIEHHYAELSRLQNIEREKQIIENIKRSEERFQNLVREATVGIIVLRGEEMIVDVVNEMYGKLIDRTPEQLLNKPLFSVIPHAEATFKPILENVRLTGMPKKLYDQPYFVMKDEKEISGFLNIVYQPYREFDGTISGVMALCHDVTEIVQARKKLEQSEEKFRSLVMQAPVAIGVFRGKQLISDIVNDSYLQLVDRSREEVEGIPLLKTLPELKPVLKPLADNILTTGEPLVFNEYPAAIKRNGQTEMGFFNAIWKPLFDLEGSVDGFIAVAHEVTPQVEARQRVEVSEQQIRSLVESAPFPIGVYTGKEMRIQFANQSIKDVWGKGDDVEGKLYAEVLPELEDQGIYQQLNQVYTTGVPFHAKQKRVDLIVEGVLQPFYFNYSFTPLFDANGEVYGVMNTAAEVTELAMAYKHLEESEARARLAIESSDTGTFDVNLKTNELNASPRLAEIFEVEDIDQRDRYVSAIHPDDLPVREQAYEIAYQTSILDYEARVIKKNGLIVWIKVKGKIYTNEQKEPERLIGIVQDITDQKNFAEALAVKVMERTEALQHANQKLLAINDELQQFAYVSSHDLQEPLRKIRLFGELLSKGIPKNSDEEKYLHKIRSSAERMSGLIKSLLDYSRLSDMAQRFELVDLNALLECIISDYELLVEQKNAVIQVDRLPKIEAIPLQMNQLFYNLLGNALKFTKRGVQPRITIQAEPFIPASKDISAGLLEGNDYILITVQDNGIGFEQEFASQIFTVFQQLNDQSSFGGYGIGLALCKKVVQAHHGLIFAEGQLGKGAKFCIILPLTQHE